MDWGLTIGNIYFNSIDVIMFALLMIGGIGGAISGFAESFSKTAGYLIGLIVALMFTALLSPTFVSTFNISPFFASLFAFVALFVAGFLLMRFLGGLLDKIFSVSNGLDAINKLLGFFWGLLEMLVLIAIILYFLRMQTLFNITGLLSKSQFVTRLIDPYQPVTMQWVSSQLGNINV